MVDGLRFTVGCDANPVPLKATVCGLPAPLSVTEIAAERDPAAAGVNVTLIWQVPFAAMVLGLSGQLLVAVKSAGLAPVTVMLAMVAVPGPLLVRVVLCAELVVFTVWLGKLRLEGDADKEAPPPPGLIKPVATVKK